MPGILREALLGVFDSHTMERMRKDYDTGDWNETRAAILADKRYRDIEGRMYGSFISHFPTFAVQLYEVAMQMSLVFAVVIAMDKPGKEEIGELVERNLAIAVRKLVKETKRMFGTRRRGGSKGKIPADKRRLLHTQYDELHEITKDIKKDSEALREQLATRHQRSGYSHQELEKAWRLSLPVRRGWEAII